MCIFISSDASPQGTWLRTHFWLDGEEKKPSTRRDSNPWPLCHMACALRLCSTAVLQPLPIKENKQKMLAGLRMLNNLAKLSLFFFCVSVDKASKIKVTVNIGWQKLNDFESQLLKRLPRRVGEPRTFWLLSIFSHICPLSYCTPVIFLIHI